MDRPRVTPTLSRGQVPFAGGQATDGDPDQSGTEGLAGLELGSYTLERPLGQGGMGTVWRATRSDGRFDGVAAVKLLNLALVSPVGQERFRREGSVLARLAHPNIARLLDAGVSAIGQPYLVLEYVDGRPIDQFADEAQLGAAARIGLFLQVLAAVGHAHANLVVHRDLKPTNILVTRDGAVKLLDFGIAKLLDPEAGEALTVEGGVYTPKYAAPEQLLGEALTTATDVYALGVLLYLLVSGRHPTSEGTRTSAACITAVLEVQPAKLGQGDLDTILGKCLRKSPAERYQSIAALADDLGRYQRQEPISARAHSLPYRAGKFVRRHRVAVLAGALMVAGLLGATVFSLTKMREAQRQRAIALRENQRADAQVEFQNVLLATVGEKPVTMREILDAGRKVLEKQFASDGPTQTRLLLQLGDSYAALYDVKTRDQLLARAEAFALQGHDDEALAEIRCAKVDNLRLQGRYREAWQALPAAIAVPASAVNTRAEAKCLAYRALLAAEAPRAGPAGANVVKDGVAAAERALHIMQGLGRTREAFYFQLFQVLGNVLLTDDQPRAGAAQFARALAAMDATGRAGLVVRTEILHDRAVALTKLGEIAESETLYLQVLKQGAGGDQNGLLNWQHLIHYAETALAQGHLDQALRHFDLVVARGQRDANLYWEGRGLFGRGRVQARLGHAALARADAKRLEEIIAVYPHARDTDDQLPDGRTIEGLLALGAGQPAVAQALFQDVLRSSGYHKGKFRKRLRPIVMLAAEAALAQGHAALALAHARDALTTASVDAQALARSGPVGEARLMEGRALLALGDKAGALPALEAATAALQVGAGADHALTIQARQLLTPLRP